MIIQHNMSAMNSGRNLKNNNAQMSKNMEKLSSGYKINRAADDAAGLAISEKMRCTVTGLEQATENAEDGVSLVRTAEGAISEIHAMLNRMKELAVQSANGTYDDAVDRNALQKEVAQLTEEVSRIVESTDFNGIPLLCRDDIPDIVGDGILMSEEVYMGEGLIDVDYVDESLKTSSTSQYTEGTVGGVSQGPDLYSSNYESATISVPAEALSVPAGSTLPYKIEMSICVYDDSSSEGSAGITTKTVSLTVNLDGSIMGSDGIDYSTYCLTTNYSNGSGEDDFYYYIDQNKTGSDPYVSTTEMQLIMENLLKSVPYSLSTGGDIGTYGSTYYKNNASDYPYIDYDSSKGTYKYNSSGVNAAGIAYTAGASVSWTNEVPAEDYYGLGSDYYGTTYKDGMTIGGSSYSTGRVLGVEVSVTTGTTVIEVESPNGFECDDWNSGSDLYDKYEAVTGNILGVQSVPEPSRTEVSVPTPYPTIDEILSDAADLEKYLIEVTQTKVESNRDEEDVVISNGYAVISQDNPVDATRMATVEALYQSLATDLGLDSMTVVWNDTTEDSDHYAIEDLCDAVASDMGITATRKLDDNNDVSIDDNVTDRYTIELGKYTQSVRNWTETTRTEQEWGSIYVTNEWLEYEYEYNGGPIILQVGDQNEEFDRVYVYIKNMRTDVEDLLQVDVSQQKDASNSIAIINDVINSCSTVRADLGAYDNRLGHTMNKNRITTEALQDAESRIRDADMAEEMMKYTKDSILSQSAQSMLSHSMQLPEGVLQLLG